MPSVVLRVQGFDKILAKYGRDAAKRAQRAALESTVQYGADLVKQKVPVRTGFLRNSIKGELQTDSKGRTFAAEGSTVYYAEFVERGTGIYGPHRTPIRPKHAKVMVWHSTTQTGKPIKGGRNVARRVAGQQGQRMFERTFKQDGSKLAAHFDRAFKRQFIV